MTERPRAMTAGVPFFAPLSGPVTQMFEFWSQWFRTVGQIGLVNIDLGRAGDAETERRILDEVGSYGRQLGRVSEALEVLIAACERADMLDKTQLSADDLCALRDFREMLAKIKARKA